MRPSTIYYKLVQLLYAKGFRPKPGSIFYSPVLHNEAYRMRGR